jgi:gamma-glutamyl-gamma-aminobutyraldehyde dehydrogenase
MSIQAVAKHSAARWRAVADRAQKKPETRLFIDGRFVDARKGGRIDCINPANGEVIAEAAAGTAEDIDRAVAAALKAFKSGGWSKMAPRARMEVMYRFAQLIDENAESLAVLETLNMGKPIADVVGIDLPAVVETIRFMAECIDKVDGAVTSTESGVVHMVLREPYGVVGAISPWNYPLLMATWKIAPALAAGNAVVLKPAEQAPLSCLKLAELFVEAGGPPGVLNVVNGLGEEAGKALALHNDVRKITFTGSTAVGKLILQYAGQSNMKQAALECGGKTPQVFMADIDDFDRAVTAAFRGIYSNMGEVCNAGSRLLVDRSIRKRFVERFVELGQDAFKPGDPLDPATNMGPLVTHGDQKRVLGMIDKGRKEGAKLEFGGDVPSKLKGGAYVNPTLFTGVRNSMTIAQQEIFGPVASVIEFNGVDEAIRIANDTIYGLAAGVWTRDLDTAFRLVRGIEAGIIWINSFDEGDMTQPFGGYKQSGNARDKCLDSFKSYTQTKSAWFRLREG